jgi:hypothetical protein
MATRVWHISNFIFQRTDEEFTRVAGKVLFPGNKKGRFFAIFLEEVQCG